MPGVPLADGQPEQPVSVPKPLLRRYLGSRRLLSLSLVVLVGGLILPVTGCPPYVKFLVKENLLKPQPHDRVRQKPTPEEWRSDEITLAWVGQSTVIINFYGTTLLTDPVLGKRIGYWAGGVVPAKIRRLIEPAVKFENLPKINVVLLSHAHLDHWDIPTLKKFGEETTVVIPPENRDLLGGCRFGSIHELKWGEKVRAAGAEVLSVPVAHWGQRPGAPARKRGYSGYLVTRNGESIFFAGDTAHTTAFLPYCRGHKIRVALLPIGDGYYRQNHATPEDAWDMFLKLEADYLLPIHWRTFILSPEPVFEPMKRLEACAAENLHRVVCREVGETFRVP